MSLSISTSLLKKAVIVPLLSIGVLLPSASAMAAPLPTEFPTSVAVTQVVAPMNSTSDADQALRTTVAKDIAKNQYPLAGGGFVSGSDVLNPQGEVNDAIYKQLSAEGQRNFVNDMVTATKVYTDPTVESYNPTLAKANGVDDTTASNWFTELKSHSGIGSKMLGDILKRSITADLDRGSVWFKPFGSPLSSFLGFLVLAIMSLLSIRAILDLGFITIPLFQGTVERFQGTSAGAGAGAGGRASAGGGKNFKLVSNAAIYAVQHSNDGNPVFIYLKKAAVEYIAIAFVLLAFVFNAMWDIASIFLDLFTGFFY